MTENGVRSAYRNDPLSTDLILTTFVDSGSDTFMSAPRAIVEDPWETINSGTWFACGGFPQDSAQRNLRLGFLAQSNVASPLTLLWTPNTMSTPLARAWSTIVIRGLAAIAGT